jgi:hypothetical protein
MGLRIWGVSALALALLGLAWPANAAALPAPTLDVATGESISQVQPLTISALDPSAQSVRISFGGQPDRVLAVSGPSVSTTVDTWGTAGPTLSVRQCLDAAGLDCGDPAVANPSVDNPAPTVVAERHDDDRRFTHDFSVTVSLASSSGQPVVEAGMDAEEPQPVSAGSVPVDVDALQPGWHNLDIRTCNAAKTACASNGAFFFEMARGENPGELRVLEDTVDPGTRVDLVLTSHVARGQEVDLTVTAPSGEPVWTGQVQLPAEDQTLTGFIPSADFDPSAADGSYAVDAAVSSVVDGETLTTHLAGEFTLDSVIALPTHVRLTSGKVFPYSDGYKDYTQIRFTPGQDYESVQVQAINSRGKVVYSGNSDGRNRWYGVISDHAREAPAGRYHVRLVVSDTLGHRGHTQSLPVTVVRKQVVRSKGALKLVPRKGAADRYQGSCSKVTFPATHGWNGSIGLLSNQRCRAHDFNGSVAWSSFEVKLPREPLGYTNVQVGWLGGPAKGAKGSFAQATTYGVDGQPAGGWFTSFTTMKGQVMPHYAAEKVLVGGRDLTFGIQADSGNRYDVRYFWVSYRYKRLVPENP